MAERMETAGCILVVDDEQGVLDSIKVTLRQAGLKEVLLCPQGAQALEIVARQPVAVVLLDLYMPKLPGMEVLKRLVRDFPEVAVVVITGAVDVETAVQCMKLGAFDYLTKPLEPELLVAAVKRALQVRGLRQENQALRQKLLAGREARPEAFRGIVTDNATMLSLFRYIEAVAPSPQPVLITGETGVGKELVARAVHALSGRRGELVIVNVAGLEDQVFSDTLFGHVRGAFTGADRARAGMIRKAAGGTLVLDEIGDLTPASQVKLLRLLQNGEYLPLGQDEVQTSDARIVATTNRNLWDLQRRGAFRKDLHYRLRTHHVHLPPLRERPEDIPLLVDHFLAEAARALGKQPPTAPPELYDLLRSLPFPGNVRELKSLIFDAVSRHRGKVLSLRPFQQHLEENHSRPAPGGAHQPGPAPAAGEGGVIFTGELPTLKEMADLLVQEAMRRAGGKQSLAARMLGISPPALSKRLKK